MVQIGKKLISNTVYLFLDWLVLTSMGFLYWIIAGKTLLPEEYGIVSTSVNFAIVLGGLSLLGINAATWKLIPEYLEKRENKKIKALIRFSLKLVIISNTFLAVILTILSWHLAPVLKVTVSVIWITILTVIVYSLAVQAGSIIYGFQNMKKFFMTDWHSQLTKVATSAILIFLGFRYFGPLIGFFLGFLLLAILRLLSISFKGRTGEIDKKHIMFEYAFPAFIAGIAWILFINGQYILLTILQNPEVTGIFTVAMIITSAIAAIPAIMTNALLPITSQLSVNHNANKKQGYLINLVFRYALFISLPAAIFLVIFSKPVILIFSRPEYLQATQLFPILALAAIIYGCGNVFLHNIYAIGKSKINRNIVIVTTLAFLLLAVPLTYKFSALGLCVAYLSAVTILASLSYFFIRKYLKISLPLGNVGKLFAASSVSLTVLYFATSFTQGLLPGLIFAFISGLIYLSVLIPMKFYIKEDARVLELLSTQSPILRKQFSQLSKLLSRFV
jgi:O-antigen/teichoic acid export membrane protein